MLNAYDTRRLLVGWAGQRYQVWERRLGHANSKRNFNKNKMTARY